MSVPSAAAASRVLNLGCGRKPRAGAVNLDRTRRVGPDVVHDLNVCPWPFADDTFEQVYAMDVIEHLDDVPATMEELHRICRHRATIEIAVPHFSSANAFSDPTHRHFFSHATFRYFEDSHPLAFYSAARFRVERCNLIFSPSLVNRVVSHVANRYPDAYESRWAWIFPAWFLSVRLSVVKPGSGAPGL